MQYKHPQLLIIENNPGDVILVKLALEELGLDFNIYDVETAEDGLDFLHKRKQFANIQELPNLIIADLSMPGIGGMELLKILKESATFSAIPIAIMTTSARVSDREMCMDLGAERVVIKPFSVDEYLTEFAFVKQYFKLPQNILVKA